MTKTTKPKVSKTAAKNEVERRVDKWNGDHRPHDGTTPGILASTMSLADLCEIAGIDVPVKPKGVKKAASKKAAKPRSPMKAAAAEAANAAGHKAGTAEWWTVYRATTAQWRQDHPADTEKADLKAV